MPYESETPFIFEDPETGFVTEIYLSDGRAQTFRRLRPDPIHSPGTVKVEYLEDSVTGKGARTEFIHDPIETVHNPIV